jgi:hypothetical protein
VTETRVRCTVRHLYQSVHLLLQYGLFLLKYNEKLLMLRVASDLIRYVTEHGLRTWSLFPSLRNSNCAAPLYHSCIPSLHLLRSRANGTRNDRPSNHYCNDTTFCHPRRKQVRSVISHTPCRHQTTTSDASPSETLRRRRPGNRWVSASLGKECSALLRTAITSRC